MNVEKLTKFFIKEINSSPLCIQVSDEDFKEVWEHCKEVNFIYDEIYKSPFNSYYEFGSLKQQLANQICYYYSIFKKYKDLNKSKVKISPIEYM